MDKQEQIAFLSVAVLDRRYIAQLLRLKETIEHFHPESAYYHWIDQYPDGSKPWDDSIYGFKVHAVRHALAQGHTKIIWIDTACILTGRLDSYFDLVKDYGVVAVKDDNLLANHCCSSDAFAYFGMTPKESIEKDLHLVGGSLYVFDFSLPLCRDIFGKWEQAEADGMFGNAETREHRHDESCMSFCLHAFGSKPVPYGEARYNDVPNPLVIKKHFK